MRPSHDDAAADVLAAEPPALTIERAEEVARTVFGVGGEVRMLVSERDQNFAIREPDGGAWVLKVSNAAEDRGVVEMEVGAIDRIAQVDPGLPVPRARPALDGSPIARAEVGGTAHLVRLIPLLAGRNPRPEELTPANLLDIGAVVARVARALRGYFHPAAGRLIWWDQRHLPGLVRHADLIAEADRRDLLQRVIARFEERVLPHFPALRSQVIHNDLTLDNLLVDEGGNVTGIIDFGDMAHTALVLDVPASLQSLFRQRGDELLEVAETFLTGYTSIQPLEPLEADLLVDLVAGRMAQTILISAQRTRRYPDNAYIRGWSEPAWALLAELERIGFDEAGHRLAAAARRPASQPHARPQPQRPQQSQPPPQPGAGEADDERLLERRRRVLGSALEPLAYRSPLHIVRARGSWMFDAGGRRYLDAYNNVPVVGHAHPRVVEAIARQAATLNTNTRYLHEHVVELAERLTASVPDGLDTVMFVNSGSEANDLAWRLATTVTGGDTGIVTEWAYHGVTHAIADFSPSEWPHGEQPATVETIPAPNTYRGDHGEPDRGAAAARADMAATLGRIADRGRRPAALFLDATFTADGIFVPAPAVVAALIAGARAAGALYIADEVQSGHGRTGDGLWGFGAWGVTPDIVTLGKPMGNGHPIAALITRSDIVDAFAARTTYFSTFGGNPVACAAALAVLDVIRDESLVANAAVRGSWLRGALAALAREHPAIGDVRGRGLMIGVELVEDPVTLAPDSRLAARVTDEMRDRGVLIGATGRAGNTLKIRPPLCLTAEQAELLVTTLDAVLRTA